MLTRLGNPVGTTMTRRPLGRVVSVAVNGRTSPTAARTRIGGADRHPASTTRPISETLLLEIHMSSHDYSNPSIRTMSRSLSSTAA